MFGRAVTSKSSKRARWLAAVLIYSLGAGVSAQAQPAESEGGEGGEGSEEHDPWQNLNRRTFAFNEGLDRWVLMPVAKGWDFITPDFVQTGVANVFATEGMVIVLANDILQLKPIEATQDVGRIVVNVTVGLAGLFDVASKIGIPHNDEDFGQTLGYWGVPAGPFLMLPIFGPSNPRDTLGLIVDTASAPWTYFVDWYISIPVSVFEFVNLRTIYLEDIDELRHTALDYYVFQRNAYVQSRDLSVKDLESIEEEAEEDLYYFDDEDEDEE